MFKRSLLILIIFMGLIPFCVSRTYKLNYKPVSPIVKISFDNFCIYTDTGIFNPIIKDSLPEYHRKLDKLNPADTIVLDFTYYNNLKDTGAVKLNDLMSGNRNKLYYKHLMIKLIKTRKVKMFLKESGAEISEIKKVKIYKMLYEFECLKYRGIFVSDKKTKSDLLGLPIEKKAQN